MVERKAQCLVVRTETVESYAIEYVFSMLTLFRFIVFNLTGVLTYLSGGKKSHDRARLKCEGVDPSFAAHFALPKETRARE
jgi:hypothetical protein